MTIFLSLCVLCAASRSTSAQLFLAQMCKHARPTGEVMQGNLITGYYRGSMNATEYSVFMEKYGPK